MEKRASTTGQWLRDEVLPDGAHAVRLAETLNVSLDWLLRGLGPMDPPDLDAYARGVKEGSDPIVRALKAVREARDAVGLTWPDESYPPRFLDTDETNGTKGTG